MMSRARRAFSYLRRIRDIPGNASATRGDVASLRAEIAALHGSLDALHTEVAVTKRLATQSARDSLRTDPDRIRIAFLLHNPGAWPSIGGVILAALGDERFDVFVLSIPKRFPGATVFSGEDVMHRLLKDNDVPHWRLDFDDDLRGLDVIRAIRPDVLFRQSQWDTDVPGAYSTENLAFTRLCLVGYEIQNTLKNVHSGGGVKDATADSAYHRACWRVFAANDVAMSYAAKKSVLRGRQFVNLGHPKCDAIRQAVPAWPISGTERRWRVMWSPHHSVRTGWSDFGMFPDTWRDMVAWAEDEPQVEFVFSPHPGLRSELAAPDLPRPSRGEVAEFWRRWESLNNTAIADEGDYLGLIQAANVIVTDGISMLYEPQVAGKPVLFLERPGHAPFNRAGRIMIEGAHRLPDVRAAREWNRRLRDGEPDPRADAQRDVVARLFEPRDAAAAIVDYIAREIEAEARTSR